MKISEFLAKNEQKTVILKKIFMITVYISITFMGLKFIPIVMMAMRLIMLPIQKP